MYSTTNKCFEFEKKLFLLTRVLRSQCGLLKSLFSISSLLNLLDQKFYKLSISYISFDSHPPKIFLSMSFMYHSTSGRQNRKRKCQLCYIHHLLFYNTVGFFQSRSNIKVQVTFSPQLYVHVNVKIFIHVFMHLCLVRVWFFAWWRKNRYVKHFFIIFVVRWCGWE